MRILFLAFLFVFFMPHGVAKAADTAVGVFAATEGSVKIGNKKAGEGSTIALGDTIETGKGSNALISLIDGTDFSLGENARLVIDEYIYDPDHSKNNKARYSVLRGAFTYASGLIAKRSNPDVEIETTYGTIGIRGTKLWGGTVKDEYGVFVEEGKVDFANNAGRAVLGKGQGTTVAGMNAMPAEVSRWGQELIGAAFGQTDFLDPATMVAKLANAEQMNAKNLEKYLQKMIKDNLPPEIQNEMKNLPIKDLPFKFP